MVSPNLMKVGSCELAVYAVGEGKLSVLFLHGNSLSSETFSDQLTSSLASSYRLVAIDLPGHGHSPKPANPTEIYQMPSILKLVSGIVNQLGLERVVVVGNSLGGHVATQLLKEEPKVAGIVIFGAPALGKPPRLAEAFLPEPTAGYLFKSEPLTEEELEILAQNLLAQPARDAATEVVKKALRAADPYIRSAVGAIVASGDYHNEEELLETASVPVAIVQGVEEKFVSLPFLQDLEVPRLWRGQVQVLPDAAHCPQLERPDAFNQILGQFLEDVGKTVA